MQQTVQLKVDNFDARDFGSGELKIEGSFSLQTFGKQFYIVRNTETNKQFIVNADKIKCSEIKIKKNQMYIEMEDTEKSDCLQVDDFKGICLGKIIIEGAFHVQSKGKLFFLLRNTETDKQFITECEKDENGELFLICADGKIAIKQIDE